MLVVIKKKADRMQKKAGIQANNQVSKNWRGVGGREWKSQRSTEIYTVDNLQDLEFDLEGNTNPVQVQGMKDFLGKSITGHFVVLISKPMTERCHLRH